MKERVQMVSLDMLCVDYKMMKLSVCVCVRVVVHACACVPA